MTALPGGASPRVLLSVEEAADALAISRTLMFALLRTGSIESVKVGHRRFVAEGAIAGFVARLSLQQVSAVRRVEGN